MTTVIHKRDAKTIPPEIYVYIGRPSKWGNPFVIGKDGSRDDVINRFRDWWYADAQSELRAEAVVELKDKVLGCWCKPLPCHGDVIALYVNRYWPVAE